MKRRDFFRKLGLVAGAAVVAPAVIAKAKKEEWISYWQEQIEKHPEQEWSVSDCVAVSEMDFYDPQCDIIPDKVWEYPLTPDECYEKQMSMWQSEYELKILSKWKGEGGISFSDPPTPTEMRLARYIKHKK
jgi:hypothetical protein